MATPCLATWVSVNTGNRPFFFPAINTAEAVSRIFAVAGRAPDGTRGEKRALVALRDALGLDVEIARTNAVLGKLLAEALDVEWVPAVFTERNTVTLDGLNALLEGATEAQLAGSLHRLRDTAPLGLTGPAWAMFHPARSKIEAVTRIAALTNAPKEWLGPGGKEHKSVLLNLADALLPEVELNRSSKTKLGASLSRELGVPWDDRCESTGETISLTGLNTVLAGAERHLGLLGSEVTDALATPQDEGQALTAALLGGLPNSWDGRKSVTWLRAQGLRGANDNEWQGFYGEEQAKLVLGRSFTPRPDPPRTRFANTVFDYALNRVWDIKVHTETHLVACAQRPAGNDTQLNDETAVRLCVAEQGLGFLTVNGAATMDETGEFVAWHRAFKGTISTPSNSGVSRRRKAAFRPTSVEAFWVADTETLEAAVLAGQLGVRAQGRQAPRGGETAGAPRPSKFEMRMVQARDGLRVARHDWSPNDR